MSNFSSRKDGKHQQVGFSDWIPNQWRKHGSEDKRNMKKKFSMFEKREKITVRATVEGMTDFKNLLSTAGTESATRRETGKKKEKLDKHNQGTFEGGDRENLSCTINILSLSENIRELQPNGKEPCFLGLIRRSPEWLIQFSSHEKYIDFFFSELRGKPKADSRKCVMEFEFVDDEEKEVKSLEVQFTSRNQFEQLVAGFGRYIDLVKENTQVYEPNINDITKNLGGQVDGPVFYKTSSSSWDDRHIEAWLDHVPYQNVASAEIMTIHQFLKVRKLFPRPRRTLLSFTSTEGNRGPIFQPTSRGADFSHFHYDKLVRFFKKLENDKLKKVQEKKMTLEELEEVEEGEDFRYLTELCNKCKRMLPTLSFEVKLMDLNSLDGQPYFNYNYNRLLKKSHEMRVKKNEKYLDRNKQKIDLLEIRNDLLVKKRFLWSVVDCIDHIISLMFYKMGVEDWIRERVFELEGSSKRDYEETRDTWSTEKWKSWKSRLEDVNTSHGIRLEEVNYHVWLDHQRMTFKEERAVIRKEWKLAKTSAKEEGMEPEEVEMWKAKSKKLAIEYKASKVMERKFNSRKGTRLEEYLFLISETRRKSLQKFFLDTLISKVRRSGMFDFGVKTVLSLMPSSEKENFNELFIGNMTKLGLRLTSFFGKKPSFAKFGFCHSSVTFKNLAIHWFSNSLIMLSNLRSSSGMYEEVVAIEAGCPTLVFGSVKTAYDQILNLAEFVINANVEYEYTFMGSLRDDGSSKKVNCQLVTRRLLKELKYTKYDQEVKQFVDEFVAEYSKFGKVKPENTVNSRWLPVSRQFWKKFESQLWEYVKNENLKSVPKRVYFNHRKEVCQLVTEFMKQDPLFAVNHPGVYQLMKGFNRAFQIIGQEVDFSDPFTIGGGVKKKK